MDASAAQTTSSGTTTSPATSTRPATPSNPATPGNPGTASSQAEIARRAGLPIHPPKIETFDLQERINTDSKGHRRRVDEYRVTPFGLYLARPMVDHPRATYVESWLLPDLGLRITDWWWRPGQHPDQDFYLDIVDVRRGAEQWRSTDHYLDVVVREGAEARVIDVDEFVLAVRCGLLGDDVAERAMTTMHATVEALARHGYDLAGWLSSRGIQLTWHKPDRSTGNTQR